MTCLLNTFGKIGNLENIVQFLQKKDKDLKLEINHKNDDEDEDDSKFKELENKQEGYNA
jgi:hypothetical protein